MPDPRDFELRLPFVIGDEYDPIGQSLGEVSFAGDWVVVPFGGTLGNGVNDYWRVGNNPDIWFEVVPGTVLTASVSGVVRAEKNPIATTPEGNVFDPKDWEVHISIGNGTFYLAYVHVVELQVIDGQQVSVGDAIGRASPAAIRHGGQAALNQVDEFEWGVREATSNSAVGWCPTLWLPDSDQARLLTLLDVMKANGAVAGDSVCLVDRIDD